MTKHVMVPVDFSAHGQRAVPVARALADRIGARITLIHVLTPGGWRPTWWPKYEELVSHELLHAEHKRESLRVVRDLHLQGREDVTLQLVAGGRTAQAIAAQADRMGADMLVLASRGRPGLRTGFGNGVVQEVLRCAPCPVVVVRDEAARVFDWVGQTPRAYGGLN